MLLEGTEPDGGGIAFSEYEAHGTDRPARMVRRGQYKLNYYHGEPVELFDVVVDPGELDDLANSPEHAALREELTALVLRDWDPSTVNGRARESQRLRRTVVKGSPHLSFAHWDPADDDWQPLALASAALTD